MTILFQQIKNSLFEGCDRCVPTLDGIALQIHCRALYKRGETMRDEKGGKLQIGYLHVVHV